MEAPTWMMALQDEDMVFMKKFMLHSGSLKLLAKDYGVTYPTIRLRLDRVIEKIKISDRYQDRSDFEIIIRGLYADAKLDGESLKIILDAHSKEKSQ